MNLDQHAIGASIRARRVEASLTQAELAERLHVSAQSVSNWERGDSHSYRYPPTAHAYTACSQHEKGNKHMKLITCEFYMDSGCVELRFDDGTQLDIDCTAVEHEYGHTIQQRAELDWMIYNAPLEYAQLVLSDDIVSYLR